MPNSKLGRHSNLPLASLRMAWRLIPKANIPVYASGHAAEISRHGPLGVVTHTQYVRVLRSQLWEVTIPMGGQGRGAGTEAGRGEDLSPSRRVLRYYTRLDF